MKNIIVPVVGLIICLTCLIIAIPKVMANDDVIGYTEHGIPITEEDLIVDSININTIRSWNWNNKKQILTLTLNNKRKVNVTFFQKCFDMEYAGALEFKNWSGGSFLREGDSIIPIGWTNTRAMYPCTVKQITDVIEVLG